MRMLPVFIPLALAACQTLLGPGVPASGYAYELNTVSREYVASLEHGVEASRRALKSLGMAAPTDAVEAGQTTLASATGTADKEPVQVVVRKLNDARIYVGVQIGKFRSDAHFDAGRKAHDAIASELKKVMQEAMKGPRAAGVAAPTWDPPTDANEVREEYVPDYDRVWRAALAAIQSRQYRDVISSRDGSQGVASGLRSDGAPVEVVVQKRAKGGTLVGIRIGRKKAAEMLDEGRALQKQIRRELGIDR